MSEVVHAVRASEAARIVGVPAATVRAWAQDVPGKQRWLFPVDRHPDGYWLYDLADVRRIAAEKSRRKRRRRGKPRDTPGA